MMEKKLFVKEHLKVGRFQYLDAKHILLCGDKGYIKYCGITMTSIFLNNPDEYFEIHLVCDDISEADFLKLQDTSKKFNVNINIYKLNAEVISDLISSVNKNLHISVATFFRLIAFDILDSKIKKILYMDSDILVIGKIDDFWSYSLDGDNYALVIKDVLEENHKKRIPVKHYFNAGVMLLDLEKWQHSGFTQLCIDNIKKYRYAFMDQDALNVVLENKCIYLPKKFDFICDLGEEIDKVKKLSSAEVIPENEDVRIVHFCGRSKPWCSWVQDFNIVKKFGGGTSAVPLV